MDIWIILLVLGLVGTLVMVWHANKKLTVERTRGETLEHDLDKLRQEVGFHTKQRDILERQMENLAQREREVREKFTLAAERLQHSEERGNDAQSKLENLRQQHETLKQAYHEMERNRERQIVTHKAHLEMLDEQKKQLKAEFENLANRIFKESTKGLSETNQTSLQQLLNPFREQLGSLKQKIETNYGEEAKERRVLSKELEKLHHLNIQLHTEAGNLVQALKGDNKTQGNWGELKLARLLELSGMQKGTEYELEVSSKGADGKQYRPDAVIYLPEEKHVVLDAKMSLLAHTRYHEAEDDAGRETALAAHLASVETHVKILKERDYTRLEGLECPDFVLMFIPVEAAFQLALQASQSQNRNIFEYAMQQHNIIIVGPSTLLVTLRTIAYTWKLDQQRKRHQEIARAGADLYDKFCTFVDKMEMVSKSIEKTNTVFNTAWDLFCRGRGNLIKRVENLRDMGITPKKAIDTRLLERAMDAT